MFCPRCGQTLPNGAAFCITCGQPLAEINSKLRPHGMYHPPTALPPVLPVQPQYPQPGVVPPQQPGWPPSQMVYLQQVPIVPPIQPPASLQHKTAQPAVDAGPIVPTPPKKKTKVEEQPKKLQVPDPTFSKFIDAPDPPLPFRWAKVIFGLLSIAGSAYLLLLCNEMRTFYLITHHAKDNIPGISLLLVAFVLIVASLCGIFSKLSRGAAGTGAMLYFIASGVAFACRDDFEYFTLYAVTCIVIAIVLLISAAGGVHIELDE